MERLLECELANIGESLSVGFVLVAFVIGALLGRLERALALVDARFSAHQGQLLLLFSIAICCVT
jgi:hypothetical protein